LLHQAQKNNQKLSFMARFENNKEEIRLRIVLWSETFCCLSGSGNKIAFYSNRYSSGPLLLCGSSARAQAATGIWAKMINLSDNMPL